MPGRDIAHIRISLGHAPEKKERAKPESQPCDNGKSGHAADYQQKCDKRRHLDQVPFAAQHQDAPMQRLMDKRRPHISAPLKVPSLLMIVSPKLIRVMITTSPVSALKMPESSSPR